MQGWERGRVAVLWALGCGQRGLAEAKTGHLSLLLQLLSCVQKESMCLILQMEVSSLIMRISGIPKDIRSLFGIWAASLSWSLLLGWCSQYVGCFLFSRTAWRDERGPLGQLFQSPVPKTSSASAANGSIALIVDSSFPQCPHSPKKSKNAEVLHNWLNSFCFLFLKQDWKSRLYWKHYKHLAWDLTPCLLSTDAGSVLSSL